VSKKYEFGKLLQKNLAQAKLVRPGSSGGGGDRETLVYLLEVNGKKSIGSLLKKCDKAHTEGQKEE